MRKTTLQQQQIVMAVDRETGILDLSVFVKGHRRTRSGTPADRKIADRGSAARSRLCGQKVEEEGNEALGPLYFGRRFDGRL
jgi:hypothetical protein